MMESPGSWVGKLLKSIQAIGLSTDLAKFIYTLATYRGVWGSQDACQYELWPINSVLSVMAKPLYFDPAKVNNF